MGYSISIKCKSMAEADKMMEFLEDNADKLLQLSNHSEVGGTKSPGGIGFYRGDDIAYPPNGKIDDSLIGMNMIGSDFALWAIGGWVAYKVGKINSKNEHYFYYDEEKMIIGISNQENQPDTKKYWLHSETGHPYLTEDDGLKKISIDLWNERRINEIAVQEIIKELSKDWDIKNKMTPTKKAKLK